MDTSVRVQALDRAGRRVDGPASPIPAQVAVEDFVLESTLRLASGCTECVRVRALNRVNLSNRRQ